MGEEPKVEDVYDSEDTLSSVQRDLLEGNECTRNGVNATYVNFNFMYGSCAEVERLCSIVKHTLTDERRGVMSPHVFETILFLKVNRDLWSIEDLVTVDQNRRLKEV